MSVPCSKLLYLSPVADKQKGTGVLTALLFCLVTTIAHLFVFVAKDGISLLVGASVSYQQKATGFENNECVCFDISSISSRSFHGVHN